MAKVFPPFFVAQFFNDDGDPVANGWLEAFYHGTSDHAPTYNNSDNENANPISLDNAGRCQLKLQNTTNYDFKLYDADMSLIETFEGIQSYVSSDGGGGVSDHSELTGRNSANQHPTSAITGLDTSLSDKLSKSVTSDQTIKSKVYFDEDDGTDQCYTYIQGGGGYATARIGLNSSTGYVVIQARNGLDPYISVSNSSFDRTDMNAVSFAVRDGDGNDMVVTIDDIKKNGVSVLGGAVDSVNGQTGVVVLDYADVGAAPTVHGHVIGDVSGLQTALDGKVDENTAITGATKTKITYDSKGLVTAGDDAGISDITGLQSALDNYTIALSTGVITWSGSFSKIDATHVSIPAITGQVVGQTANRTAVSYAGSASVLDDYVNTTPNTYYLINSAGVLIQQSTPPTPVERRNNIYIGFTAHAPVGTITVATADPDIVINELSQVRDLFGSFGFINKGIAPSANGANIKINTSAGYIYGFGIGYTANVKDPCRISVSAQSPVTFQYRTQTGSATGNLTDLEVGFYDVAGTRTALSGTKYTTQRIYCSPAGLIRFAYGQVAYNSMASALAGINSESYVKYPPFGVNFQLIGLITVKSTATNLTDTTQAVFTSVSIFGEAVGASNGTSTTNLQQAYDNSSEPEIITNPTLGAISIKRGSALDSDNVFEIQNGAGSVVANFTGEGKFSFAGPEYNTATVTRTGSASTEATTRTVVYTGTGGHTETLPTNASSGRVITFIHAGTGVWTVGTEAIYEGESITVKDITTWEII